MTISRFSFPTDIHFGPGASKLVGDHLRERGFTRPIVVTDKGLAALPVLKNFVANLGAELNVHLFAGVHGNPAASQAMQGRDAFRAHQADCVIGIGGGAALDVAKVVALMAVHDGDVIEYAWDHPRVRPITTRTPVHRRATDDQRYRLGSRTLQRRQRRQDAYQAGHLLAEVACEGGVCRSGVDDRPATRRHCGHRNGCTDAQHRVVSYRPRFIRYATVLRSKACESLRARCRPRSRTGAISPRVPT